jgi:mono/diheme cytochrome c family protein
VISRSNRIGKRLSFLAESLLVLAAGIAFSWAFRSLAHAQSDLSGTLVDVRSVAGDGSVACWLYSSKGGTKVLLARVDGTKIVRKSSWTLAKLRKPLAALSESIEQLRASTARTSSTRNISKKLKSALQNKKILVRTKRQIRACVTEFASGKTQNAVRFQQVRPVIEMHCMQCHSPLGWKNEEAFFLQSGRIVAQNLGASPFYTFLSNNPEQYLPAYMPKGDAPLSDMNILLLNRWIAGLSVEPSSDEPQPEVPISPEEDGRVTYANQCAACHGPLESSSKWGSTEAQIAAALGPSGIPQMRFLALSAQQIRNLALVLGRVAPPTEGTLEIRGTPSVSEGSAGGGAVVLEFEVVLNGTTSKPFTVGYATSNGSALAGSDYAFTAGILEFQGTSGESKTIKISVLGDSFEEADESLFVDIGGVSLSGVRISNSTASATILNDDTFSQYLPPLPAQLRMAYGFNGDFHDILRLSDALPQASAALTSAAKIGSGALELTEGLDHLLIPGQNLVAVKDFTFGAWVYWQNPASTTSRIFDFGSSAVAYLYFSPRDPNNRCRFELRIPGNIIHTLQCSAGVTLPANTWVHLATSINSATGEMKIFFNGQQVASRIVAPVALPSILFTDNKIGKSRMTGQIDFSGKIDELSIWDAALTTAELAQLMAMDKTAAITSSIELRLNGNLVPNGSTLNLGALAIGEQLNHALTISNVGVGGLALLGTPKVEIVGRDAAQFAIRLQPWPWQELLGTGSFTAFSLRYTPTSSGDKSATLIVNNSDFRNGNYAVGLSAGATGQALPTPTPPTQTNPAIEQGQALYATNCSSCHGVVGSSQKRGLTLARLNSALDPSSGVPQMRGLGFSSEQKDLLVLALNSAIPPSPSIEKASGSALPVGTAPFVASVLSNVFLPDNLDAPTADDLLIQAKIRENILGLRSNLTFIPGRIGFLGGRCSRFDPNCQTEATTSSQMPAPNTIRAGLINRACDEVLTIDRAVNNALAKIQRVPSDKLDASAGRALYQLFSGGRELPQHLAVILASSTNGAPSFSEIDQWRFTLSLLCISNEWEVL